MRCSISDLPVVRFVFMIKCLPAKQCVSKLKIRWMDTGITVSIHPFFHTDQSVSHLSVVTDIHARKTVELSHKKNARQLEQQNTLLRSKITQRSKFGNLVGKSEPMQAVYEQIINAASSDATVIIYGEPGTGKELVAHAIHDMSARHPQRFVPVHCGAIPENLIESEFFGLCERRVFRGWNG